MPDVTAQVVARLAVRSGNRTEADIQSDIQTILTSGRMDLDAADAPKLEEQLADGTRRRIDIAICHAVIEVKKDLRNANQRADAEQQLQGYVSTRRHQYGRRFVGIASDGVIWVLYDLRDDDTLAQVSEMTNTGDPDRVVVWLEAILASQDQVTPTPSEIAQRLGSSSPGHLLDFRELTALYDANSAVPEIKLKRELWAKLLKTAFGSAFTDDSSAFINHTLLVLTAELIAHAVLDIDISATGQTTPRDLVSGKVFDDYGIHGVVEQDFFDWVVDVPGGTEFVATLAARVARFNWNAVEHDVLKHLYESVISQESRRKLGEYYTPDWLADRVVAASYQDPLNERVLDPSCGSGTFLFHCIRAYLAAADTAGTPNKDAVTGLTRNVIGMDIHPVAVTLARVTYLLAIGTQRLNVDRPDDLTVPVYLGDSLQWEQNPNLFTRDDAFTVDTSSDELVGGGGGRLFDNELIFPLAVLQDAGKFDRLVSRMADLALDKSNTHDKTLMAPVLRHNGITDQAVRDVLTETFRHMRDLARTNRNHIWGYYVRNLIRPVWLALPSNKVDVLVGNPPWLRYSKMTAAMKNRYKLLAKPRNLLTGGLGASGRDLSTLFVVRAVEMYLNDGGSFAFVMPHGTLTRLPHTGFRTGRWASSNTGALTAAFKTAWDLTHAPTGFPMVSCVINGVATSPAAAIPKTVTAWASTSNKSDTTWQQAAPTMTFTDVGLDQLAADDNRPVSPYKSKFRQGAVLIPLVLGQAEDAPAVSGSLGLGAGRRRVQSRRSTQEKDPWKKVPSITATVEAQHVHRMHNGSTVVPYRHLDPLLSVLPIHGDRLMTPSEIAEYSGLSGWWTEAEERWKANKSASDPGDFLDRIDFHGQLSAQLPLDGLKVVYTKAGNKIAAAMVSGDVVIDHKLYWAPVSNIGEGRYLVGILNSETLLARVAPLQAVGLFGPRDFDKNVFYVPFPSYNGADPAHQHIAALVEQAETLAATVNVSPVFTATRAAVRAALVTSGLAGEIEAAVQAVLPVVISA